MEGLTSDTLCALAGELIGNISITTLCSICRDLGIDFKGDHIDIGEMEAEVTKALVNIWLQEE